MSDYIDDLRARLATAEVYGNQEHIRHYRRMIADALREEQETYNEETSGSISYYNALEDISEGNLDHIRKYFSDLRDTRTRELKAKRRQFYRRYKEGDQEDKAYYSLIVDLIDDEIDRRERGLPWKPTARIPSIADIQAARQASEAAALAAQQAREAQERAAAQAHEAQQRQQREAAERAQQAWDERLNREIIPAGRKWLLSIVADPSLRQPGLDTQTGRAGEGDIQLSWDIRGHRVSCRYNLTSRKIHAGYLVVAYGTPGAQISDANSHWPLRQEGDFQRGLQAEQAFQQAEAGAQTTRAQVDRWFVQMGVTDPPTVTRNPNQYPDRVEYYWQYQQRQYVARYFPAENQFFVYVQVVPHTPGSITIRWTHYLRATTRDELQAALATEAQYQLSIEQARGRSTAQEPPASSAELFTPVGNAKRQLLIQQFTAAMHKWFSEVAGLDPVPDFTPQYVTTGSRDRVRIEFSYRGHTISAYMWEGGDLNVSARRSYGGEATLTTKRQLEQFLTSETTGSMPPAPRPAPSPTPIASPPSVSIPTPAQPAPAPAPAQPVPPQPVPSPQPAMPREPQPAPQPADSSPSAIPPGTPRRRTEPPILHYVTLGPGSRPPAAPASPPSMSPARPSPSDPAATPTAASTAASTPLTRPAPQPTPTRQPVSQRLDLARQHLSAVAPSVVKTWCEHTGLPADITPYFAGFQTDPTGQDVTMLLAFASAHRWFTASLQLETGLEVWTVAATPPESPQHLPLADTRIANPGDLQRIDHQDSLLDQAQHRRHTVHRIHPRKREQMEREAYRAIQIWLANLGSTSSPQITLGEYKSRPDWYCQKPSLSLNFEIKFGTTHYLGTYYGLNHLVITLYNLPVRTPREHMYAQYLLANHRPPAE